MSKMTKDKRDKLMLTIIGAVGTVAVLYFFVISDQKIALADTETRIEALQAKKVNSERTIKREKDFQTNLERQREILTEKQKDMPRPGEDRRWFDRIIEGRRSKYALDIGDVKNPLPTDPGVLPKFPFSASYFDVTLVGAYTDFGRFLADFENSYPYMRVQLVSVTPEFRVGSSTAGALQSAGASTGEPEAVKLRFNFRVISLIKTPT